MPQAWLWNLWSILNIYLQSLHFRPQRIMQSNGADPQNNFRIYNKYSRILNSQAKWSSGEIEGSLQRNSSDFFQFCGRVSVMIAAHFVGR